MKRFPYEYIGGGYWRQVGVPKKQAAEMFHGDEILEVYVWWLISQMEQA
jgi:hypothetical protein